MTQEEKELLLKDLCARLTYGVVVEYTAGDGSATIDCHIDCISIRSQCVGIMDNPDKPFVWRDIISIKPYLRPMSSMTEEEKKELKADTCPEGTGYFDEKYLRCPMNHYGEQISYDFMSVILEWLNSHHFDYRGLIEKGLALKASEDMYK